MDYSKIIKELKGLMMQIPTKRLWLLWTLTLTLIVAWRLDAIISAIRWW